MRISWSCTVKNCFVPVILFFVYGVTVSGTQTVIHPFAVFAVACPDADFAAYVDLVGFAADGDFVNIAGSDIDFTFPCTAESYAVGHIVAQGRGIIDPAVR